MTSIASTPTARLSESDMDADMETGDDGVSTLAAPSPAPNKKAGTEQTETHNGVESNQLTAIPTGDHSSTDDNLQARLTRLDILLKKSTVYSSVLGERMNQARRDQKARDGAGASKTPQNVRTKDKGRKQKGKPGGVSKVGAGSKRDRMEADGPDREQEPPATKRLKSDAIETTAGSSDDEPIFEQPDAITGATLKDYQLVGVAWLVSLWENGVNGILADEMGLGKTLQTISFLAYVRQRGAANNTLIVCPLSVLHNWADEFEKFAPSIPVCVYHGTPAERADIRSTWASVDSKPSYPRKNPPHEKSSSSLKNQPHDRKSAAHKRDTPVAHEKSARKLRSASASTAKGEQAERSTQRSTRRSAHRRRTQVNYVESDDSDTARGGPNSEDERENDEPAPDDPAPLNGSDTIPIVLTTYEMIIKDRQHLTKYKWNFIVVDEGHRLKNMDCKLIQEIKKYDSANRLILTGTPLHNNLAELWSLLNFILPDIFQDLDSFQQWFNLPTLQNSLPNEQSHGIISKLHQILKPFLLRRLKADVEHSLPPKKEYVLYAPLSERQREIYDAVLQGMLRRYLINEKHQKSDDESGQIKHNDKNRSLRVRRGKVNYAVDDNDDDWFRRLDEGEFNPQNKQEDVLDVGRRFSYKNAVKQVNSMNLQNTVMQLRKVCSHPFLFDWPSDPVTRENVVDEQLVNVSGKMMVLNRLLVELFRRGHKVLLFSQFTTMLDIIEEWALSFKQWSICRIDGSTPPDERRSEMYRFQDGGSGPQAPHLFLLSTRAGGLGINLTAADTVIFYDQDWNPQMDLQAMDRAHRIGQKKPVLVFRLVSAHTVETKIMQKANEKRKLEALVIAKGKFRMPGSTSRSKGETVTEMAASLLKLEGEKIEVVPNSEAGKAQIISDADLDKLLDRSPEVFSDRVQGWTSGAKTSAQGKEAEVAFEVFQAPVDECNDGLAAIMGEKIE